MKNLILKPASIHFFLEIVSDFKNQGKELGSTIEYYYKNILDKNLRFAGIFIPQYNGFLGFNLNRIYNPIGGLKAINSICEEDTPLESGCEIFIFQLGGKVIKVTV